MKILVFADSTIYYCHVHKKTHLAVQKALGNIEPQPIRVRPLNRMELLALRNQHRNRQVGVSSNTQ